MGFFKILKKIVNWNFELFLKNAKKSSSVLKKWKKVKNHVNFNRIFKPFCEMKLDWKNFKIKQLKKVKGGPLCFQNSRFFWVLSKGGTLVFFSKIKKNEKMKKFKKIQKNQKKKKIPKYQKCAQMKNNEDFKKIFKILRNDFRLKKIKNLN